MSYHQRLKEQSTSASKLEEQKRRMGNAPTIEELEARLQETEQAFRDASHFQGYEPEEVPVDDGAPPSPPDGVTVSPWFHQLDVSWNDPLEQDFVIRAFLRVTRVSTPTDQRSVEAQLWSGSVSDLAAEPYKVEVSFQDRWGRLSDWSAPVQESPKLTAAEYIDLTEAEIAGSLGWENLDALDANSSLTLAERQAKLGDDVITARAMAAQNLAATRLWAQTGAFESAMIGGLVVDKLIAGTFTAGDIALAGNGAVTAGGGAVKLSATGLTMRPATEYGVAGSETQYKINVTNGWSEAYFFNDPVGERGFGVTAEGAGQSIVGAITLEASHPAHGRQAVLDLRAGRNGSQTTLAAQYQLSLQGEIVILSGDANYIRIGGSLREIKRASDGTLYT